MTFSPSGPVRTVLAFTGDRLADRKWPAVDAEGPLAVTGHNSMTDKRGFLAVSGNPLAGIEGSMAGTGSVMADTRGPLAGVESTLAIFGPGKDRVNCHRRPSGQHKIPSGGQEGRWLTQEEKFHSNVAGNKFHV